MFNRLNSQDGIKGNRILDRGGTNMNEMMMIVIMD